MFKLNNELLEELGLGSLPVSDKNMMLRHIYETLELRVGMKLAERMTSDQLSEFEQLMPQATDSAEDKTNKERNAFTWLETNFPNYKEVVAGELENLKAEIRQAAPQILSASQENYTQEKS